MCVITHYDVTTFESVYVFENFTSGMAEEVIIALHARFARWWQRGAEAVQRGRVVLNSRRDPARTAFWGLSPSYDFWGL